MKDQARECAKDLETCGLIHSFDTPESIITKHMKEAVRATAERMERAISLLEECITTEAYWHRDGCAGNSGGECDCWVKDAKELISKTSNSKRDEANS